MGCFYRQAVIPSRTLNETGLIFGLNLMDFAFGVFLFGAWSRIFEQTALAPAAFLVSAFVLVCLSGLRRRMRRRIIRDWIGFYLMGRTLYDPRD